MNVDATYPDVPKVIFDLSLADADLTYGGRCEEIWDEIQCELLDASYMGRSHHSTGTYDLGCRGPLCRKAQREHPRRKAGAANPRVANEHLIYDPVIDYFHVVMKHRIKVAQQALLKELNEQTA